MGRNASKEFFVRKHEKTLFKPYSRKVEEVELANHFFHHLRVERTVILCCLARDL